MSAISGTFPFAEPLRPVIQLDRGANDVFVLGVYLVTQLDCGPPAR